MASKEIEKRNPITTVIGFARESWAELRKVQRPSREEATRMTIGVFFMVFVFALFLGLIDFGLGMLMRTFLT